jgi:hypothetical protein
LQLDKLLEKAVIQSIRTSDENVLTDGCPWSIKGQPRPQLIVGVSLAPEWLHLSWQLM